MKKIGIVLLILISLIGKIGRASCRERVYGATQNMWIKGISQSIFEASV